MSAQMAAMVVNPNVVIDNSWYPDSGATNHCTPDPNNLIIQDIYAKNDQIHMGDGTNLAIQHIGQSTFPSQFSSKLLVLKQLLHVPSISKNLLSVSKFAHDNNVFFEFHYNQCFVKDQVTRTILL